MPCAVSSLSLRRRAPAWEKTRAASSFRRSGRFRIVPALPEHLETVLQYIRPQDARELLLLESCMGGSRPLRALLEASFGASRRRLALLEDRVCLAVGGVIPLPGGLQGWVCPWFTGTRGLEGNAAAFRAVSRYFFRHLAGTWPRMINLVHAAPGNPVPAWLERLGFTLLPVDFAGARLPPERGQAARQDIAVFFRNACPEPGCILYNFDPEKEVVCVPERLFPCL